jgi:PAS domain S-box-containing protein
MSGPAPSHEDSSPQPPLPELLQRWGRGEDLNGADLYRGFLDTILGAVWMTDAEDRVRYASGTSLRLTGTERSELEGSRIESIKALAPLMGPYLHARETLEPQRMERLAVTDADGEDRFFAGWLIPRSEQGRFDGMVGLFDDTTRYERALEELRRERETHILREGAERFRALLDAVPMVAVQGYRPDGTIIYWNRASETIYGYTAGEAVGQNLVELIIPPEMRPMVRDAIATGAETGQMPDPDEHRLLHKDGSRIPVYSSHVVIRLPNEETELFCLDVDLRQRKAAEAALVEAERLAAVGRIAAGVAHQFNNLNTPVLGCSELMLAREDLDPDARRWMELIRTASVRVREITENLLTFAQPRRSPTERHTDLNRVVEEAIEPLQDELDRNRIELEWALQPLPPMMLDPDEIRQVVHNLLINALHALLDCPRRRILVQTDRSGRFACLRVTDSGCGIPTDELRNVFTPFFSRKGEFAHAGSIQSKNRGVGLGLSVCQTIARQHGGEIEVHSQPGEGSAFTVWLPLPGGEAAPDRPAAPAHRVLLVDDDELTVAFVREVLENHDIEVDCVLDGESALNRLLEEPYDLLILDLGLPFLSGDLVVRKLAEMRESLPTILVMTGKGTRESARAFRDLPVADILHKPFSPEVFLQRVEGLLGAPAQQKRPEGPSRGGFGPA